MRTRPFTINSCPARLYQGDFCDLAINFTPGSGGSKTAQIEVVSGNGVAPPRLTVAGLGVGGVSPFLVTSGDLDFGDVRVGARSEPLALKMAAAGDGVITVTAITASEPFSVVSQTCPPLPFVLPLGTECAITVVFTPVSNSSATGTLRVETDAPSAATDVRLTGDGQSASDLSGGGCSMADGRSPNDPTLWTLLLLSGLALYARRRRATSRRVKTQGRARE